MFPFRWDELSSKCSNKSEFYSELSIDKRVKIDDNFFSNLKASDWESSEFSISTHLDYNEYAYFYDFVKDSIYNKNSNNFNQTSYYFKKKDFSNNCSKGEFKLRVKKQKDEEDYINYELILDGLSLRVFDTGIAILILEIENREYKELSDILNINDFARRVYPQFLSKDEKGKYWTEKTKEAFLPDKIEIKLPSGETITDNFECEYENIPKNIQISKYIMKLLGDNFTQNFESVDNKYLIQPILDDRMFVLSWYGNDDFAKSITSKKSLNYKNRKNLKNENLKDKYSFKYKNSDNWYKYLFVDNSYPTCQNEELKEKLLIKSTYARWLEYNTLYGISRYSFVCVSKNDDFAKDVLPLPHIKTMYFQMFSLILAMRASILKFADEVSELSDIKKHERDLNERVSNLYRHYIRFRNCIHFREVTPQEQGIELYDLALKIMKIDKEVKDLDNEISELHSYVSLIEERKNQKTLDKIQIGGAILLLPTLIAGIFGMNTFSNEDLYKVFNEFKFINNDFYNSILIIITTPLLIFLIYFFIKKISINIFIKPITFFKNKFENIEKYLKNKAKNE